jgi:outer membrane protein TolC
MGNLQRTLPILLLSLLIGLRLAHAETVIDERTLIEMTYKASPVITSLKAKSTQADLGQEALKAQYETRAQVSTNYASSSERALASFIPVYKPSKGVTLGLQKNTPFGIALGIEAFGESMTSSDGFINNAARSGARMKIEVDLLKNLLGRQSHSELQSQKLAAQIQNLETQLDIKGFEIEVRKLYWSLVANSKSLALSEKLVLSAKKQLRDSKSRLRAGAADAGDVARNQALLNSRESSVYLFRYQREQLLSQLRQWVPDLKNISFGPSTEDIATMSDRVHSCVEKIISQTTLPLAESDYTQILDLLEKRYQQEKEQASATGDWDLKLQSSYQTSGVGEGVGNSWKEFEGDRSDGYQFGLVLSIPLEGKSRNTESLEKRMITQQFQSQIRSTRLKLSETHKEVVEALKLLKKATRSQGANVEALEKSFVSVQNKYRQARIDLTQMILEQDTLFNSKLQSIKTKLDVIHALYNYFKVYNKNSCQLNRLQRERS